MQKEITDHDQLRHLQMVLLEMMKEIDTLCRRNGITYYLNGGNALGAVRHRGFIPWDDDLDIMMTHSNHRRFIDACRRELDPGKWYVQESWHDWPGTFSKVRLRGTFLKDIGEWNGIAPADRGIYIDIFEVVNAPESPLLRRTQYLAAKMLNAYSLLKKGYTSDSLLKKAALSAANLLRLKAIRRLCHSLVFRYEEKPTKSVANFFGMSRFRSAFYPAVVFAEPVYKDYEDTLLPLPTGYEQYLTQAFGDYMQLPPEDKRRPAHSLEIDFGNY